MATTAVAPISARTPSCAAVIAARSFGMIPPSKAPASSSLLGLVGVDHGDDDAAVEQAGDVGDEEDPLGLEPDGERRGGLVGVDVQRPGGERRDDRDQALVERGDDRVAARTGSGSPTSPSIGT